MNIIIAESSSSVSPVVLIVGVILVIGAVYLFARGGNRKQLPYEKGLGTDKK